MYFFYRHEEQLCDGLEVLINPFEQSLLDERALRMDVRQKVKEESTWLTSEDANNVKL